MAIKLNYRYRLYVSGILWLISFLGIATSFFALPVPEAVILSIALAILPPILNRIVFVYPLMHVMPLPSEDMRKFCLGTTWFADNTALEGLGLMILYKDKDTAKQAFQVLRAWNLGKKIDDNSNIVLTVVDEGEDKYSVFIYPGERPDIVSASKNLVEVNAGRNSEANVSVVKYIMHHCFDYTGNDRKKKCIEALPHVKELRLNVGYVEDEEIKPYSKAGFRLRKFSFQKRNSPTLGQIEKNMEWADLAAREPAVFKAITEKINSKLTQRAEDHG